MFWWLELCPSWESRMKMFIKIYNNYNNKKKIKKKENNFYATYSHLPNSYFQTYKTVPI